MKYPELDGIDIRQIKLTNGDEIISFVQGIEEDGILLERPLQVNYELSADTAVQSYYLTTWLSMVDPKEPIWIGASKVLTAAPCTEEVKFRYIKVATNYSKYFSESDEQPDLDEVTDEYEYDDEETSGTIH
jgi:hypothetical protein